MRGQESITLDPVSSLSCLLSNNMEYILFSPGLSSLSVNTCGNMKRNCPKVCFPVFNNGFSQIFYNCSNKCDVTLRHFLCQLSHQAALDGVTLF